MCKALCQACVQCRLFCSFSQNWNALFNENRKEKTSVYVICFDSVKIIFNSSQLSCLFNFIFHSPLYLLIAIVAIAAVQYISVKLNEIVLKTDYLILTQYFAKKLTPKYTITTSATTQNLKTHSQVSQHLSPTQVFCEQCTYNSIQFPLRCRNYNNQGSGSPHYTYNQMKSP